MSLFDEARRRRETADAWARDIAREASSKLRMRASCEPEAEVWADFRTRLAGRALILERGELRKGGELDLYQPKTVVPAVHPDGTVPPLHVEPADFIVPPPRTKPQAPAKRPSVPTVGAGAREIPDYLVKMGDRLAREKHLEEQLRRIHGLPSTPQCSVPHNPSKHTSESSNPLFRAKQRADQQAREDARLDREDKALASIEIFIRGVFAS